jgi:hypothetical protein
MPYKLEITMSPGDTWSLEISDDGTLSFSELLPDLTPGTVNELMSTIERVHRTLRSHGWSKIELAEIP